ncbi:hypothetical protein Pint_22574 [Pistacia integerrima]|uniref:Uncharacterized protein n=1 Tax=Pistacia integerrima TaxID=434235 RepID=A0ACC0YJG2_9ROSI|nr:hypothetical protein Pint_22574 [Pistacia integerrima]
MMQINYFRWDKKEDSSSDFFRFCCLMTKFRYYFIDCNPNVQNVNDSCFLDSFVTDTHAEASHFLNHYSWRAYKVVIRSGQFKGDVRFRYGH